MLYLYHTIISLSEPSFVTLQEIGDYIYIFFIEKAIEADRKVSNLIIF